MRSEMNARPHGGPERGCVRSISRSTSASLACCGLVSDHSRAPLSAYFEIL